jgi:LacI family transcriptional regulator
VRRRPTIEDVAREAQVSIATVSRVLNDSAPVAIEVAARVRHVVAELDYRPTAAAQVLARRRSNAIGLLLSRISGDYFAPLLRGIEAEVSAAGMNLLISTAGPGGASALADHNTDGLLAFADSLDAQEMRQLWRRQHPLVLLHRTPPEDLPIPCVTVENKSGARTLVDHLVETHGYERIAFLRGPVGHEDSTWRELGYRESLLAHGIEASADLVGEGEFSGSVAEAQVTRWLAAGLRMDAIFAGDDASAAGTLQSLRAVDMHRSVAVVGFDDLPLARHLAPPLTTVRAPTERVGREAARQLLDVVRGRSPSPLVLLPTQLVVRQSCGCPPRDGPEPA